MPFKVIVAGGGPVGLTAAHALHRANIPFTLLEMRDQPAIDAGSSLVLQSVGLRALSQLGLFDELCKVSSELKDMNRLDHNGNDIGDVNWFHYEHENFGTWPRVISRRDLTHTLYNMLPEVAKASILCNKKVSNVESTGSGVRVHCADGSIHEGSIIVGADGAHSPTRRSMRTIAAEHKCSDINEEQPFLSTFRCLWFRFPRHAVPDLTIGTMAECHGPGAATQLFVGEATAAIGFYERLPKPTRERLRFTPEDEAAMVAKWSHLPIARGKQGHLTLGQAYATRTDSGLVTLEEGVLQHWHWNARIVLVGDAAHKYTPSLGSGCNHGIVDIMALANELRRLPAEPSEPALASAFGKYQDARQARLTQGCKESGVATDTATWGSGVAKMVDRWVIANTRAQRWFAKKGAEKTAATIVFDYIPGEESMIGKKAWVNAIPTRVEA